MKDKFSIYECPTCQIQKKGSANIIKICKNGHIGMKMIELRRGIVTK